MPGRQAMWIVLFTAALAWPLAADAQEPDDARIAEARERFNAGQRAYEDGDLVGALSHFEAAYELTGNPETLFNIGTVAERMGRTDLAVEAYRSYLNAVPDAPERAELEDKLATLTGSDEAESPPPRAPQPIASEVSSARTWAIVAGVATAAFGGLAIGFWLDAQAADDELAQLCATSCGRADIDDSRGPRSVTLTNVFLVASAVGLATTGVLAVLALDAESSASIAVGPGSVALRGSF